MLALIFFPQGAGLGAGVTIDVADAVDKVLPVLGSYSTADLLAWTEAELYEWADEAAQRIAQKVGMFVARDTSQTVAVGTADYALPTRHLSTIHLSIDTDSLRATNRDELEALDATWPATTNATVDRHFQKDKTNVTLYPEPAAGASGTIGIVHHEYPSAIAKASSTLSAPLILNDYFCWAMAGEARGKESDGAMPEVSEFFSGLVDLFDQAAGGYWGLSQ